MARRFDEVDVFSNQPFGGNPVGVVIDGEGLSSEAMQRFANWTNFSETTFLVPPTDATADYRLRIFTTTTELPFAGHPTLGSCHAWLAHGGVAHDESKIVQQCAIGNVTIRRGDDARLGFAAPPLVRSGPLDADTRTRAIGALGLDPATVVDTAWIDNGPGWIGVLLGSAAEVLGVRPATTDLKIGVIGPHPAGAEAAFEVRAFFPGDGVTLEDPVTGSLNASAAQWLIDTGRAQPPYVVRQGTALGRYGRVHVSAGQDNTVWIGGDVTTRVTGTVEL